MKQKLHNISITDLNELHGQIDNGAKFILFNYRLGLGLVSLLRFSPAIFIIREQELELFKKKYNRINLAFGPWFLLKGPFLTYNAYQINKKGGVDITKDIMANITPETLIKKEVVITKIHSIFTKVKPEDKKEIVKAIKRTNFNLVPLKKVYIGLMVNVPEDIAPYIVIGIQLQNQGLLITDHIDQNLRKYFYKHVPFEIFNLEDDGDLADKLIEQGDLIYGT